MTWLHNRRMQVSKTALICFRGSAIFFWHLSWEVRLHVFQLCIVQWALGIKNEELSNQKPEGRQPWRWLLRRRTAAVSDAIVPWNFLPFSIIMKKFALQNHNMPEPLFQSQFPGHFQSQLQGQLPCWRLKSRNIMQFFSILRSSTIRHTLLLYEMISIWGSYKWSNSVYYHDKITICWFILDTKDVIQDLNSNDKIKIKFWIF